MEVLITVTVVGLILLAGSVSRKFWLSRYRQRSRKTRQQWASRSPEKLSEDEQAFCRLVARGIIPNHAMDGITLEARKAGRNPDTRAMAAKWMKKPKIKAEIERQFVIESRAGAERIAGNSRCRVCHRVDCDGSCQANTAPDDYPTADLIPVPEHGDVIAKALAPADEPRLRILPALEPWEGMW